MLTAGLRATIRKDIASALAPIEVVDVQFSERQTYDGDDVIDIIVLLPAETGPLPTLKYMQAIDDVSRTLLRANDERMPFLNTRRVGEPETAEEEAAAAS